MKVRSWEQVLHTEPDGRKRWRAYAFKTITGGLFMGVQEEDVDEHSPGGYSFNIVGSWRARVASLPKCHITDAVFNRFIEQNTQPARDLITLRIANLTVGRDA